MLYIAVPGRSCQGSTALAGAPAAHALSHDAMPGWCGYSALNVRAPNARSRATHSSSGWLGLAGMTGQGGPAAGPGGGRAPGPQSA